MEPTTDPLHSVRVSVVPEYLPEHSNPGRQEWMHAYTVTITNSGGATVRLLSRHWVITNAHGSEEHVRGSGVVGEQPVLRSGESFTYTSGCPMDTEVGTMHGTYNMEDEAGAQFDATIAPFTLAPPFAVN
jgi:ApaG protein